MVLDIFCLCLEMYCELVLGCILSGPGDALYVGLSMCFVKVWGCIVCRFGDVFRRGVGMYCV